MKMLMPASASGRAKAETTPISEKLIGPSTLRHRHPRLQTICSGTLTSGQITDSSSSVRVIEKKQPVAAQGGIAESASRRQIARASGRGDILSLREMSIQASYPALHGNLAQCYDFPCANC